MGRRKRAKAVNLRRGSASPAYLKRQNVGASRFWDFAAKQGKNHEENSKPIKAMFNLKSDSASSRARRRRAWRVDASGGRMQNGDKWWVLCGRHWNLTTFAVGVKMCEDV